MHRREIQRNISQSLEIFHIKLKNHQNSPTIPANHRQPRVMRRQTRHRRPKASSSSKRWGIAVTHQEKYATSQTLRFTR